MALEDALGIAALLLISLSSLAFVIALSLPKDKRTRILGSLWRKFM